MKPVLQRGTRKQNQKKENQQFKNAVVTQFNGSLSVTKLEKAAKAYCNRKLISSLSEAIEDKEALNHEDFVTAKINWRKHSRQEDQNKVTMIVVTNTLDEKAEMAIQDTNGESIAGMGGVQNF